MIELLVVIMIIGILAAIALPVFLGQPKDSSAKSDARNLMSQIESCYVPTGDYTDCNSAAELTRGGTEPIGVPYGPADGQAEVTNATPGSGEIVAHSRSGNDFRSTRPSSGDISHDCTTQDNAGCPSGGDW